MSTEMVAIEPLATDDSDTQDRPVRFTPIISDEGCPGYRVTWFATGKTSYIYLNASVRDPASMAEGDDNSPNVFVYEGTELEPRNDLPLHYYSLEEPK